MKWKERALTIALGLFTGFSFTWILSQRYYLNVHTIYLNTYVDGTASLAIDVTPFIIGLWLISLLAMDIGLIAGMTIGEIRNYRRREHAKTIG